MARGSVVWLDGKLLTVEEAKISLFTHALHYGMGAFEGIR
ncbi:branched chain amino acid aminotransferase, partial [bacterium]|nr:branched chain amino acid aminotransferase [bacterium]